MLHVLLVDHSVLVLLCLIVFGVGAIRKEKEHWEMV